MVCINGIMEHVALGVFLLSLNTLERFARYSVHQYFIPSLYLNTIPLCVRTTVCVSISIFLDRYSTSYHESEAGVDVIPQGFT